MDRSCANFSESQIRPNEARPDGPHGNFFVATHGYCERWNGYCVHPIYNWACSSKSNAFWALRTCNNDWARRSGALPQDHLSPGDLHHSL
jgi:hypothetical protein